MDVQHSSTEAPVVDWEQARSFHGHLGPWLALGLKIGHEAVRRLHAEPHWGVRVMAECALRPPVSCLLDGLQLGTGATYGKRNLSAQESETVRITALNTKTGLGLQFRIKPEAAKLFEEWYAQFGEDETAYRVYAASGSSLYEIVETSLDV